MKRKLVLIALTLGLLLTAKPGIASQPIVTGYLDGVELCAQFQCGVAVFVGRFHGQIDTRWARGGFLVFINHEPLPQPGQSANIIGGQWSLRGDLQLFQGDILNGTLVNNGDNTFRVTVVLQVAEGGAGGIVFTGALNHNDFPPTIVGTLTQPVTP